MATKCSKCEQSDFDMETVSIEIPGSELMLVLCQECACKYVATLREDEDYVTWRAMNIRIDAMLAAATSNKEVLTNLDVLDHLDQITLQIISHESKLLRKTANWAHSGDFTDPLKDDDNNE